MIWKNIDLNLHTTGIYKMWCECFYKNIMSKILLMLMCRQIPNFVRFLPLFRLDWTIFNLLILNSFQPSRISTLKLCPHFCCKMLIITFNLAIKKENNFANKLSLQKKSILQFYLSFSFQCRGPRNETKRELKDSTWYWSILSFYIM